MDDSLLLLSALYVLFLDSRVSESGTHLPRILSLHPRPLSERCHGLILGLAGAGVTNQQHLRLMWPDCVGEPGVSRWKEALVPGRKRQIPLILFSFQAFKGNLTHTKKKKPLHEHENKSAPTVSRISIITLGAQMGPGFDRGKLFSTSVFYHF